MGSQCHSPAAAALLVMCKPTCQGNPDFSGTYRLDKHRPAHTANAERVGGAGQLAAGAGLGEAATAVPPLRAPLDPERTV